MADVERLQRLYLKLRFNAFPMDGGLALFKDAPALNDCAPNASLSFCQGQLSVVLGRDLEGGRRGAHLLLRRACCSRQPKARRAALYTGFLFRCGCLRCASDGVLDAPIVDAAAEALAKGGRRPARTGARGPLRRLPRRGHAAAPGGPAPARGPFPTPSTRAPIAAMACWRGLRASRIDATARAAKALATGTRPPRPRRRAPRARPRRRRGRAARRA